MGNKLIRAAMLAPVGLSLLLTGCGGMNVNVWPFGGEKARDLTPANSTEYQCKGNKRFYVRNLDNGSAVWLIYPDRQVRLDKIDSATGAQYSNGIATLTINGDETMLADGPAVAYSECKAAGK
ncbi:MAG: MliC family protein [Sulfuricella sp.]|nr:MliC family protein [Sulfuricella sp.]